MKFVTQNVNFYNSIFDLIEGLRTEALNFRTSSKRIIIFYCTRRCTVIHRCFRASRELWSNYLFTNDTTDS